MTWTFTDSATPSLKDRVRILVQDVDSTDPQVSDESIGLYVTGGSLAQSNIYLSAAFVAGLIAGKYRRLAQRMTAGGTQVDWGDRAKAYEDMAKALRATAARSGGIGPYIGGVSRSEIAAVESNTDRVTPAFTRTTGNDPAGSPGFDDRVWQ